MYPLKNVDPATAFTFRDRDGQDWFPADQLERLVVLGYAEHGGWKY